MLPNMVSSGRLLPVLEAKQSFSVGLSVFENWADQIETELSSSLVSDTISGGIWETITSYQRFTGWVASTLVSVSLKTAFLVEFTSSVYLTTLKIAKSLVISESGSPSAAVVLHDMPLGVSAADIKTAFSVFGNVTHVVLKSAGIWQYVMVYFEKLNSAVSVLNH
ncbi:hypothetical protein G9A89_008151 [Geosiphon pyriformis]|nr:hypothetical protein G9A89_008151 [Geosiphon pyriformis]